MDGACPSCGAPFEVDPARPEMTCGACGDAFTVLVPRTDARKRAPAGAPVVPTRAQPGAPRCARHTNNAAPRTCARCGAFMCAVCETPSGARLVCGACFERELVPGEKR